MTDWESTPARWNDDTPLFNDGIGLEFLDSLEIISAIDEEYGVPMTVWARSTSGNIDALAAYVVAHAE